MSRFHLLALHDRATPFFWSVLLTSFATSIPHAILTPILLSKGVNISEILLIQAAFSVAVFASEFPSGALADVISRRSIFFASQVTLCVFFLMVIVGAGFPALLAAWVVYGVSGALGSGTLDAALVNNAKNSVAEEAAAERRISWLARTENQCHYLGMIVGSVVGAVFYQFVDVGIYYFSIAATACSSLGVILYLRIPEQRRTRPEGSPGIFRELRSHLSDTVREVKVSRQLRLAMVLVVVVQAFLQLHFQVWQAVALEKGVQVSQLIVLYVGFMILSFLASYIRPERLMGRSAVGILCVVFLLFCGTLVPLASGMLYLGFYFGIVIVLVVLGNYAIILIRKTCSIERIGALTSAVSVLGRVGAVVTLLAASTVIRFWAPSVVVGAGIATLTICLGVWFFLQYRGARLSVDPVRSHID